MRASREQVVQITSGAGLELVWSGVAVIAAVVGIAGTAPLQMSAASAIAMSFALLAESGVMASRWPAPTEDSEVPRDAIAVNVIGAFAVLAMGSLALAGIGAGGLAPLALLVLAGFLVLDAPVERALIAPRGSLAAASMAIAGIASVVVLAVAVSTRRSGHAPVAVAALLISAAQLVGALAVLVRSGRELRTR